MTEETTRAKSAKKPADHKPAKNTIRKVEYLGETYEFDVRAANDIPTMFALRDGELDTVMIAVVGKDGLERAIESFKDEDGYADFEKLNELVKEIYEKAASKNS